MTRTIPILLALLAAPACSSSSRTIRIPESAIQSPKRGEGAAGKKGPQPYVMKMSDGQRIFQFEIPGSEVQGAFSASIPLDLAGAEAAVSPETPADRELREAAGGGSEATTKPDGPAPPSYLNTLAKVNALFRKRQYELALIELVKLEQSYPDDERLLEMKGTLYWRLRKPKLAREAWERALAINPENTAVAQALENLLAE